MISSLDSVLKLLTKAIVIQLSIILHFGPASGTLWAQNAARIKIVSIETEPVTVSQGQLGITIKMLLENSGPFAISSISANLTFYDSNSIDRTNEYIQNRVDGISDLPRKSQALLIFEVDVNQDALLGEITIDGKVTGIAGAKTVSAEAASATDSWVVQKPALLTVEFTLFEPFQTVNDTFKVEASVKNLGNADVDDSGELRLNIPVNTGYSLLASSPRTQHFMVNKPVEWEVATPGTATEIDIFTVEISKIPLELNRNQPAFVSTATDTAIMKTLDDRAGGDGFVNIDSVRVVEPKGAKDGTLSTDQEFRIMAFLHREKAVDVVAQIFMPASYDFVGSDDFTKSIENNADDFVTITWNLKAPRNSAPNHFIYTTASGRDEQTGRLITAIPDTVRSQTQGPPMLINVVEKANLRLLAAITDPPSARDSILTVNQNFTITTQLVNEGVAEVEGPASIEISLPGGFTTSESLIKDFDSSEQKQVTWQIKAPSLSRSISVITAKMRQIPEDVNTNQPASSSQVQVSIPVSIQETPCLIAALQDERHPVNIARGAKNVSLLALELQNTADVAIMIQDIKMVVKDKHGNYLAPNSTLARLSVVDYFDPNIVYAQVTQPTSENPIQVNFMPEITVLPLQSVSINFRVDILQHSENLSLQLLIETPQQDISAIDSDMNSVAIKGPFCLDIEGPLSTGISNLTAADLQSNFFNFPNPFGSRTRPITSFHYYLKKDSDIIVRIYTLLGELVWSRRYSAIDAQGSAGIHDGFQQQTVVWDGTNSKKQYVLNGVYVAVLKTNTEKAMTKIAVAK